MSLTEENAQSSIRSAMDLSIVMPAFNEEKGIGQTLEEIQNVLSGLPIDFEIIVIDDGSSDGTRAAAEKSGARVISNDENRAASRVNPLCIQGGLYKSARGPRDDRVRFKPPHHGVR